LILELDQDWILSDSAMATSKSAPSLCFQRALEKFNNEIPEKQREEFNNCTLQDVYNAIKAIQTTDGPRRKMRNMNRLKAFLEAMNQLGKVIEQFLNANQFIGYVWVCLTPSLVSSSR
jgi:hypothetical protein